MRSLKSVARLGALAAAALAIGACSLGKDSSEQNAAQRRENKRVNDLYGKLVGTYEGKLTNTDHGDETISMVVYIDHVQITNPDGTPGAKDVPKAVFRRADPVVADYGLTLSNMSEDEAQVVMSNPGDEPDVRTIDARVNGKQLSGTVYNGGGTLGKLDLTWVSADTTSRNDTRDRLLKKYQEMQGSYIGRLVTNDPVKKKFYFDIELSAVMVGNTPQFVGLYKRLDVPEGWIDLSLTVSFRPDKYPAQITMNGKGAGKYELDMNGTIEGNTMQITIYSLFEGNYGLAILKKQPGVKPKTGKGPNASGALIN
jgi:hypothetical protein